MGATPAEGVFSYGARGELGRGGKAFGEVVVPLGVVLRFAEGGGIDAKVRREAEQVGLEVQVVKVSDVRRRPM